MQLARYLTPLNNIQPSLFESGRILYPHAHLSGAHVRPFAVGFRTRLGIHSTSIPGDLRFRKTLRSGQLRGIFSKSSRSRDRPICGLGKTLGFSLIHQDLGTPSHREVDISKTRKKTSLLVFGSTGAFRMKLGKYKL